MADKTMLQPERTEHADEGPLDEVLDEIRLLIPAAFPDGQLNCSVLSAILSGEAARDEEVFGLQWPGRSDALSLVRLPSRAALLPCRAESVQPDDAEHVLVGGENLEVMKLLHKSYFGRFKMVYMDPPYNIGEEFIYEDDYTDPLRGYLQLLEAWAAGKGPTRHAAFGPHSRWLSMMLPRIWLARNLLTEDGVLFVSLDDHEVHHLRLLLDEVFGPENLVCNFIWEKRYSVPPDTKDVGYVHENILCYRRSDLFDAALLPMSAAQRNRYKNPDNDPRGDWKAADYTCRFTAKERPTLYYPIVNPNTGEEVWPKKSRVWASSPAEHAKNVAEGRLWWPPDAKVPAKKRFASEIRQGAVPQTILHHKEVGHTDEATKELRAVFPGLKLTPKPTRLLRRLMAFANLKDGDLVLDCFAGTGSLGEAVIRLREEAGPKVRVVMIQIPEPSAGTELPSMAAVALERLHRALKSAENGGKGGVRVFRLGTSAFRPWKADTTLASSDVRAQLRLAVENVDQSRLPEELLFEMLLKAGLDLCSRIDKFDCENHSVFSIGDGLLLVCLDSPLSQTLFRALIARKPEQIVCLDSAFGGDDVLKTNVVLEMRSHAVEFRTL